MNIPLNDASKDLFDWPNKANESGKGPARKSLDYWLDAFWRRVDTSGDCWNWIGDIKPNGYGSLNFCGRKWNAHKLSWIICNGPVPEGLCCCHKCDNRKCVNPSHMFLGTHQENIQDCFRKGRNQPNVWCKGTSNPNNRLTEGEVREIKRLLSAGQLTQKKIAEKFGVQTPLVWKISSGRLWKNVQLLNH